MASRKQISTAKKNIKKAQSVWDRSHYSAAEGRVQKRMTSGGEHFHFKSKHATQKEAVKKADNIRKGGFKARVKQLDIGGKRPFVIYKGKARKRTTRISSGTGPKGHRHSGYKRSLSKWTGYGKREKPGLGRRR